MSFEDALRDLLRDIVREARQEAERIIRTSFLDPLQEWLQDLLSRSLPDDWQTQLHAQLEIHAAAGFTLSPKSVKDLEQWIIAWADRGGLLPRLQFQLGQQFSTAGSSLHDLLPSMTPSLIDPTVFRPQSDGISNLIANDVKQSPLRLSEQLAEEANRKGNPALVRMMTGTLVGPVSLFDRVPGAFLGSALNAQSKIAREIQSTDDPIKKAAGVIAFGYGTAGIGFGALGLVTAQGELLALPSQVGQAALVVSVPRTTGVRFGPHVEGPLPGEIAGVRSANLIGDEGFVNLASERATIHILYGDGPGSGGHLWPGQPGKTPFPQGWSPGRIMHEASDIATDPNLIWTQQSGVPNTFFTRAGNPARFEVIGVRGGETIRVIIEPAGKGIITAHPIR